MLLFVTQLRNGQGCPLNLLQRICMEDWPKTLQVLSERNNTNKQKKKRKFKTQTVVWIKSSLLATNGSVQILSSRTSLRKIDSAFWWTKYFCTCLFLMNNLRSDHAFAEAITDLHQINITKHLGEGWGATERGELEVSWAVAIQAGTNLLRLMLFLPPKYD